MIGYFIVLQNTVLQSIWNTLFKGDIADVKALTVKQMLLYIFILYKKKIIILSHQSHVSNQVVSQI